MGVKKAVDTVLDAARENETNGDVYTGEFAEDRMCGRGNYVYANGDRFVGSFRDDLPHGEGVHILAEGGVHGGMWEFGQLLA